MLFSGEYWIQRKCKTGQKYNFKTMNELFDFEQDYVLEDERVLLRPLRATDWEILKPFAEQEPEIWRYSAISAAGAEDMEKYIATALQARAEKKEYPFIVFDKREQVYAGSSRFYDIQTSNKTLQLGYTWYGKQFQGTGLNKHCKFLLLRFAFEVMQVERVEFRADADNQKSIAAMKSIGCTVEGILRNNMPKPWAAGATLLS
jgi:RimJ/RimL family protein N-acetyltransferase